MPTDPAAALAWIFSRLYANLPEYLRDDLSDGYVTNE
jgi:hypothetical protein